MAKYFMAHPDLPDNDPIVAQDELSMQNKARRGWIIIEPDEEPEEDGPVKMSSKEWAAEQKKLKAKPKAKAKAAAEEN